MPSRFFKVFAAVVLVGLLRASADAQPHAFTTLSTGAGKCLDVINDGKNDKLRMFTCGNYSGQSWSIVETRTAGHYRLTNDFTGTRKCVDVANDGQNDRLKMVTCGNFSGQFWSINATKRAGFYHLKNEFTGSSKCLAVTGGTQVALQDCADFAGQYWSTQLPLQFLQSHNENEKSSLKANPLFDRNGRRVVRIPPG